MGVYAATSSIPKSLRQNISFFEKGGPRRLLPRSAACLAFIARASGPLGRRDGLRVGPAQQRRRHAPARPRVGVLAVRHQLVGRRVKRTVPPASSNRRTSSNKYPGKGIFSRYEEQKAAVLCSQAPRIHPPNAPEPASSVPPASAVQGGWFLGLAALFRFRNPSSSDNRLFAQQVKTRGIKCV